MNEIFRGITSIAASMNGLVSCQDADVEYDGMSDALLWPDELPGELTHLELLVFRLIIRFRTTVIAGNPDESLRPYWEQAKKEFPRWPGFSAERCRYSTELKRLFEDSALAFERAFEATKE